MAKRKKAENIAIKILLTAVMSGVILFLQGFILGLLRTSVGDWFNIIQGIFGIAFISIAMAYRKGNESVAQSLPVILTNTVVFQLLARLPFNIPYLTWAVEFTVEGFAIVLGTVWFAEGIVQRIMN